MNHLSPSFGHDPSFPMVSYVSGGLRGSRVFRVKICLPRLRSATPSTHCHPSGLRCRGIELSPNRASSKVSRFRSIRYLVNHAVARPEGQYDSKHYPLLLASEYSSRLAVRDPGAASEWVQTLPAGDAKLWAQKNLARNWNQYDPKAAERWVNDLPLNARDEVLTFMKKK